MRPQADIETWRSQPLGKILQAPQGGFFLYKYLQMLKLVAFFPLQAKTSSSGACGLVRGGQASPEMADATLTATKAADAEQVVREEAKEPSGSGDLEVEETDLNEEEELAALGGLPLVFTHLSSIG